MLSRLKSIGFKSKSLYFPSRCLPLHAMITSCGYSRETSVSYNWDGIKRGSSEFVLFQHTIDGRGKLRYETVEYDVRAGDAMLLHFPHDNQYRLPHDSPFWEFIFICLHGSEIMRIWKKVEDKAGPILRISAGSAIYSTALNVVETVLAGRINSAFEASRLAYDFAMVLAGSCLEPAIDRPEGIDRVIEHCRRNISRPVTIDTMARIAGYSRYHFTRLFTESEGISPAKYFQDLRIQYAAGLLQRGDLGVKQIAAQCGFYDATYFCKVFRKTTGMSPRQYQTSGMYTQKP